MSFLERAARSICILVLLATGAATAQPASQETFDVARFVAPRGWQRQATPGFLSFQATGNRGGQVSSAQIFLFPSEASRGTPLQNFEAAWNKLIVAPIGAIERPRIKTEQAKTTGVILFVAKVGSEMALIVAIGKRPLVNGKWTVKGNTLTLTEDKGKASSGLFRLEQESSDGRNWKERLCVLGETGDICYRREG